MTLLLDNVPEALTRPLDDASVQARIRASELQAIPVVASQSISLLRLLDALLDSPTGTSLCLHESTCPGAAATLRAWAGAHGIAVEEVIHVVDYRTPYASLGIVGRQFSVSVCAHRDATPAESETERKRMEGVGE